ncbi:hypothetical protein [Vibrio parahaemolyticus RIMD 2210633]|uniref:Uncharacterized protein n=1 Tax=Vibrio parahaemolyticus serotype O3:K6 (strain RIMD 2210633) TaxID=223926 RepID=Q87PF3_VIBPA|nr:hypothetical protein [Vibrio parahaemolyticus RIMD 2210633]
MRAYTQVMSYLFVLNVVHLVFISVEQLVCIHFVASSIHVIKPILVF